MDEKLIAKLSEMSDDSSIAEVLSAMATMLERRENECKFSEVCVKINKVYRAVNAASDIASEEDI